VRRFLAGAVWFLAALAVLFMSLVIYAAWRQHQVSIPGSPATSARLPHARSTI
jgi:hypothetical protein